MTDRLKLVVPSHVARFVETTNANWRAHHPQNRTRFKAELKSAYGFFRDNPSIGKEVTSHTYQHLRRWVMHKDLEHVIYYRVVHNEKDTPTQINIVRVWSTHTGETPWFVTDD